MNTCCEKCRDDFDGTSCDNPQCQCHHFKFGKPLPKTMKSDIEDYEQNGSHTHCWEQREETPACGIKKESHRRCCLCPKMNPNYKSDFEEFIKKNPLK